MKKHLTSEDLSAYLDGEHSRPAQVQKHLQLCAQCARQHVALQKLSAHLKALPAPEVSFGFETRVMRAIAAPLPARRASRVWMPLGAGLAAMLAVMVSVYSTTAPTSAPDAIAGGGYSRAIVDLAGVLGPDGSESASGGYSGLTAEMQIASAADSATRPVPSEFFGGADYNETLFALDASEKETLMQLLGSSVIDEHLM